MTPDVKALSRKRNEPRKINDIKDIVSDRGSTKDYRIRQKVIHFSDKDWQSNKAQKSYNNTSYRNELILFHAFV